MNAVIDIDNVTVRLKQRKILDGLSLKVLSGEVLSLLGPSGSGKSTLVRIVLGLLAPDRGHVRLRGDVVSGPGEVSTVPEERNIAVIFQDLALWPHLTVEGNLAFGLRSRRVPKKEREERIFSMLSKVGLEKLAQRFPGELSGGERQRVAIARALVLRPDAVLLDEPLSNLDICLKNDLLDLFVTLFRENETTAIYITHDPWEAGHLGERVAVLDSGSIVFDGGLGDLDMAHENTFVQMLSRQLC